ncbi:LysM peptidoglycan-binding domain-containing protein [Litorimonas sp. RW-G-Af-16]|uniref:LysM peptidoglycan-binding domain-containing protein n=1 Tax=Litorimonas sp. RW-G-Af-16 TaxID=3241168 RepID=UPI00390CAFA1
MRLILSLSLCLALSACASVSEKIPTVKVERKKPKIVRQVSYSDPVVQKAEAAMVCDNANMRARAADKNSKNDTARVLILEEGSRSNTILADVEVNCREYFQSKAYGAPAQPSRAIFEDTQVVATKTLYSNAPVPTPKPHPIILKQDETENDAAAGHFYAVAPGDTLYAIARENCTSVNAISKLNKISDPTMIDRGQILRLPATKCNKR